ncbi:MAG: hypothetical protein DRP47_03635 [Candidatus Zixiibacteriota bacterium]|nr:MAG: hypothetical protein DRP47_03635 [candidate division Zixibacteria bacterium]
MAQTFSENNICIIANRSKTWFYDDLVKKMELGKNNVFWIVTGQPWLKVLKEAGYPDSNILYYEVTKTEKETDQSWLAELEQSMSMPIWQLIGTDRFLSKRTNHPDRFLNRVGKSIESFLIDNNIFKCFGETTWSVELLTYYIAKRASIQYLIPHTIRIPSERFAFFTDPFQSNFIRLGTNQHDWDITYLEMIEKMLNDGNIPRPNYWYINNKVPAVHLNYVSKFVRFLSEELFGQARTEYMDYTLLERIKNKTHIILNKYQIAELPFEVNFEATEQNRFALFTLHKQPEASIDVMGGVYTNQLALIEILSKLLPVNCTLLVKEHSNAIGDRGRDFYNSIISMKNVRIVDPWVNSHDLLKQIDIVFSVSGTIGMEASIMGKKAVLFCPTFFTKMPNVYFINDLTSIKKVLAAPCTDQRSELLEFYKDLIINSYEGLIGDPVCSPASMTEGNLELVSIAFKDVLTINQMESVTSG